ncbi:MAG TPA: adenylate/guanylate cyclase domain-containing protein [Candidatus Limnocylindria bacterium]|nr:adenylate/guanylate cyclase domain-containing protein [Candidatus Limnocylindria bacterium]
MRARDLPTGTLTFFFSDIEGSTRLLQALGTDYPGVLERHREIVRDAFGRWGAVEVGTDGDSFFGVFRTARDAVAAAVAIQRAIADEEWPQGTTLRLRIGLHTGEAGLAGADYVGLDVHRAARIMAVGHGGQIVISDATRALVDRGASDGFALRDLGERRLRDLTGRERLFQVVADGLELDFPPLRTLDAAPNNLPTQTSALVGREVELTSIRRHLDSPGVRLLTLTGPGGIGKTRLALQAAADQIDRFEHGVYFVDLSEARDSEAALQAIVRAVGMTVSGQEPLREALAEELRPRRLLLLLDNFEQVMEAANDVAYLLRHCPQIRAVVTSREALRVRGEQLFPVPALSLPEPAAARTAEAMSRHEAVRLFVARAREARPSFVLTDENAPTVAEICGRLDGLPLAIELAAARLKLFSPDELRDRLRSRLELLRGGARDLPERQRTLRSTIEWSYELLDDAERPIFQLLSIFASARVQAVEEVADAIAPLAGIDTVAALASLVDKSLVRSEEDGTGQRLSMLDTIREYAAERLEREPELSEAARRAHAAYFADFAARTVRERARVGRGAALDELASELPNLQAAWDHFVATRDMGQLNRLLDALWGLHDARGWYHAAVALTNDLLTVLAKTEPSPDRAEDEITLRLTLARGLLAIRGYTEEVEELYREALALSTASGAVPKRLPVLRSLASFYLARGEIDRTAAIGREVLALADQERDTGLEVEGHLLLGPALAFLGDGPEGLAHLEAAIALFDPELHGRARLRLGPNPGVAARAVSGLLHWLLGYPDAASRRAATALELAARLHHPYSRAYATFHVALLDLWNRRFEAAHAHASDVLAIAEEQDYHLWAGLGLVLQGVSAAALDRPEEGLATTERGIALYSNLKTPPVFWPQVLALRAEACALAGRTVDALATVEEASALAGEGSWDSAALKVQRADVLVSMGDARGAEPWLRRAVEEARGAGIRMIQLKAATRLARVAPTDGDPSPTALLRELFDSFTEGFGTPDLLEARALLDRAAET